VFNVIAPYRPPQELEDLFIVEKLQTEVFTKQERVYIEKMTGQGVPREKVEMKLLENKTGVKIYKPAVTFADVIGLRRLKEEIDYLKKFPYGSVFFPKAIMSVGVPGTGKSLTAKAIAGETNRYLVEVNLQKLLEFPQPVDKFEKILSVLESLSIECVLWIDEIEKAIGEGEKERKLMGRFLTILQEFNTPTGYNINGFFYITANNIILLMERYPEFFRSGRVDRIYFIDFPTKENARKIFEFYYDRYSDTNRAFPSVDELKKGILTRASNLIRNKNVRKYIVSELIKQSLDIYNPQLINSPIFVSSEGEELFIYVPAEIENLIKKFFAKLYTTLLDEALEILKERDANRLEEFFDKDFSVFFVDFLKRNIVVFISEVIRTIKPIGLNEAMEEGIKKIKSMKDMFVYAD
jgi:SpoVK/Ycf46/Vps4 family AAA+-type ATPase